MGEGHTALPFPPPRKLRRKLRGMRPPWPIFPDSKLDRWLPPGGFFPCLPLKTQIGLRKGTKGLVRRPVWPKRASGWNSAHVEFCFPFLFSQVPLAPLRFAKGTTPGSGPRASDGPFALFPLGFLGMALHGVHGEKNSARTMTPRGPLARARDSLEFALQGNFYQFVVGAPFLLTRPFAGPSQAGPSRRLTRVFGVLSFSHLTKSHFAKSGG